MQMILLGTPITADEALSADLVAQLFDAGMVLENAHQNSIQVGGNEADGIVIGQRGRVTMEMWLMSRGCETLRRVGPLQELSL
ncbi:hypothetical protein EDB80DRAFT_898181 [Ilyonectria destructans]|nr:hypothetical protein EDB80DRAFT_898181 [Ilyonectria destructans]